MCLLSLWSTLAGYCAQIFATKNKSPYIFCRTIASKPTRKRKRRVVFKVVLNMTKNKLSSGKACARP
uniref:Putative secreted protein n=1 Tax=Ixodes ricinus TaxID=34613 RepID=A0A6B0TQI5_IXORI